MVCGIIRNMVEILFARSKYCSDCNVDGEVLPRDNWDRESRESDLYDKGYEDYLQQCVKNYIKLTQAAESPGDRARRRAMDKCKN